jgi:hypothetical protein
VVSVRGATNTCIASQAADPAEQAAFRPGRVRDFRSAHLWPSKPCPGSAAVDAAFLAGARPASKFIDQGRRSGYVHSRRSRPRYTVS